MGGWVGGGGGGGGWVWRVEELCGRVNRAQRHRWHFKPRLPLNHQAASGKGACASPHNILNVLFLFSTYFFFGMASLRGCRRHTRVAASRKIIISPCWSWSWWGCCAVTWTWRRWESSDCAIWVKSRIQREIKLQSAECLQGYHVWLCAETVSQASFC